MERVQKTSIWKRLGTSLKQYAEALDYGIYDVVEEQAKRLYNLEKDLVATQAEVNLLKEALGSTGSTKDKG